MSKVLKTLGGERLASAFRKAVSGDPKGLPQWANEMAIGDDAGFYGPDSDVWKVHGSLATLVGGVRALLMQAAYPAALAGVSQHSAYDTDPLGRLERTTRWLTITSFGSTEAIAKEARRVFAAPDTAVIVDTADFQYFGATDFHRVILPSPGILSHQTRCRQSV